jgi:hypothetical protein
MKLQVAFGAKDFITFPTADRGLWMIPQLMVLQTALVVEDFVAFTASVNMETQSVCGVSLFSRLWQQSTFHD